ncbi:EthD domain-containing protein [Myxococcota bacterium]|nr:EthD domain-containing protein [Myxococcota bacterium]
MEKLVYLIFESADRSGNDLRAMLLETVVPHFKRLNVRGARLNVHDEEVYAGKPQVESNLRKGPPIRAMLNFWMDSADQRGPCEDALSSSVEGGHAGYLVVESCPLVHEVQPGERTPGVNQITCINRRPDISYETFLKIWQQEHREVAIELQSTVGYVRNVVVRTLTENAPAFDAVVEETFPIEALTDQRALYDYAESEEALALSVARMMESCERFLDFEPMEMNFMSEYVMEET